MTNHFVWFWEGAKSAEENMARDREMLNQIGCRGVSRYAPTISSECAIRFYSWNSPAITVGYSQKPKEWVNLIRCRELGIEVAHRPTGGGVVFHQRDLTWSIVGTHEGLGFDSIQQCYQKIHQAVAAGLKKHFGLSVYLATCKDVGVPSFCFAVPVGYDIMASNRKLVGGAIRWTKRGMLYQGTLPLDRDFALLKEVIVPNRRRWLESLVNSSVSLNELLMGEEFDYQDISRAIVDGFRGKLGGNLSFARGGFPEEVDSNEMRHVRAGNRRG